MEIVRVEKGLLRGLLEGKNERKLNWTLKEVSEELWKKNCLEEWREFCFSLRWKWSGSRMKIETFWDSLWIKSWSALWSIALCLETVYFFILLYYREINCSKQFKTPWNMITFKVNVFSTPRRNHRNCPPQHYFQLLDPHHQIFDIFCLAFQLTKFHPKTSFSGFPRRINFLQHEGQTFCCFRLSETFKEMFFCSNTKPSCELSECKNTFQGFPCRPSLP
jgi:hypothetical protein